MQSYTEIAATASLQASLPLILNNDKTALSNSAGTTFPTTNLQVGMWCFRTDQNKLYKLKDTTPTWVLVLDINSGVCIVPQAATVNGWTPVRQGGGAGQVATNNLFIGWDGVSKLLLSIDATNFSYTWPISISGNAATVGGLAVGNGTGNIPVSNGTVNTNLNADMVDGFSASQSAVANAIAVRDVAGNLPGAITTANNIVAGVVGSIPYQSAPGTTSMLAPGTAGQMLTSQGGAAPTWTSLSLSSSRIQPVTASVASSALTLTLNPTIIDFRSVTLASGAINSRAVGAAVSLVVPSGATLGMTATVAARLAILGLDSGGTVELAVVNMASGMRLDETGLITTTAISSSATSASVIYSTTARSNLPYRVLGFVDITETVAGTWATAPVTIQGAGGQSLAAIGSLVRGQAFVSSGTFTVPVGVTAVKVTVIGGGGGGLSPGCTPNLAGGGAGTAIKFISGLIPGSTVSVTVGGAGATGANGGTSSFGSFCSATGGGVGQVTYGMGGSGGTGSGGDLNITGSRGASAPNNTVEGNFGGVSAMGSVGRGGCVGGVGDPATAGLVLVEW